MSSVLSRAVGLLPGRGGPRPPDASAVLSALPVPVILLDPENRFRLVNHAAEQFLGISASHLAQMRLSELVPQDSPLFLLIEQVRQTESSVANHDLTLDSPRLEKRGITVMGSPLSEEPGAVVLVLQDSSGALALDRQLAFRGAARSVTGMAAVLAHEVKNPLSGIRGAAQLLEASVVDADRELTVLIRDEADRIRALVDRMEAFSEKPISRTAVNIHRVLEHVRRLAQTGFAENIRFQENYDPSLPPVWGNRDQLVQVVLNLVKNAAEAIAGAGAATAHPEIVLTTGFQHGMRIAVPGTSERINLPLYVAIRDNGPGIPEDIRPHLFEPFVTSKASGSGLGLSLVAKIIGDHGGLIEVDSKPGRTEFRLHLPVVTEKDDD
ncbi:MAG: ATP-binding protein [Acetobacteraceae bacterium]|jgi:two-component system nitrogen regulation sensor histidine kinase GlnL